MLGEIEAVPEIVAVRSAEIGVLVAPHVRLDLAPPKRPAYPAKTEFTWRAGAANRSDSRRLVEMLIAELHLLLGADRNRSATCIGDFSCRTVVVDTVRLLFVRSSPSATVKCVVHQSVGLPLRTPTRSAPCCVVVEISRHAVRVIEAVVAVRLEKSYARRPTCRELVAQRRRDALVQIAVGVRIGVRHDGRIDRREAVGLFARDGDVERGAGRPYRARRSRRSAAFACDSCRSSSEKLKRGG